MLVATLQIGNGIHKSNDLHFEKVLRNEPLDRRVGRNIYSYSSPNMLLRRLWFLEF